MRSLHWFFVPCWFFLAAAACSRHSSASDGGEAVAPQASVEMFPAQPNRPDAGMPRGMGDLVGQTGDLLPTARDATAITPPATVSMSLQPVRQVPKADTALRENLLPRAQLCFERSMRVTGPTQAGDLAIVITLGSTGEVAAVEADPASGKGLSPIAVSCVLAAARHLSFEVAGDATGVTLRPTLSFRPGN
jgi:hypothetical protein